MPLALAAFIRWDALCAKSPATAAHVSLRHHQQLSVRGAQRTRRVRIQPRWQEGELQIVLGLLTDAEGEPLAVRVFAGNTVDPATVVDQIKRAIPGTGICLCG
jgi:hypothetical protein